MPRISQVKALSEPFATRPSAWTGDACPPQDAGGEPDPAPRTEKALLTRPTTIEWRITGRCDQRCLYCYGPKKEIHPPVTTVNDILGALLKSPAEIIRFSGGEPLIYKGIDDIIRRLGVARKRVVLSTNGLRFATLRPSIEPYLAKLNISLDGYDARTHMLGGRNAQGFEHGIGALDSITRDPPRYPVKVGTVVTANSMNEPDLLSRMYDIISSKNVARWKIYQYIPVGPIVDSKLCVPDANFQSLQESLSAHVSDLGRSLDDPLIVSFAGAESRSGAYFIVEPYGDVFVPIGTSSQAREVKIGNILTTPLETLFADWLGVASPERHVANTFLLRNKQVGGDPRGSVFPGGGSAS